MICIKSLYEPSPIYSDEDFNTDFISLDLCKDCTSGDKNTDIVMNFFSGKEDLPQDLKLEILYEDSLTSLKKRMSQVGTTDRNEVFTKYEKMKSMSMSEFEEELVYDGVDIDKMFHFVPDTLDRSLLYEAVWSLYYLYGAPKIRFEPREKVFLYHFGIDAFYSPLKKELTLKQIYKHEKREYIFSLDNYFDELAHARQFDVAPCRSILLGTQGIIRSFFRSIARNIRFAYFEHKEFRGSVNTSKRILMMNEKTLNGSYQPEYSKEGTLEYEAHILIENTMKKRYQRIINYFLEEGY
ncbi:MAG: hypothetical protein R3B64_00725 [Candidatus Paceibacterota bacterium]